MALNIDTFSNVSGGFSFFKALGHPLAAPKFRAMLAALASAGPVAIYDPLGHAAAFASLHDVDALTIAGVYVQDVAAIGQRVIGHAAAPVTLLPDSGATSVLVLAFDADRLIAHIRHLLPRGAQVVSLDAGRLDDDMITSARHYLDPINFATNFAFFRDGEGHHTRLVTANYWGGYGAKDTRLWLCLLDDGGRTLADWWLEAPAANGLITIDSADIRQRFTLGDFTGQLFIHVVGGAGHDVVKYALDTYGDADSVLSCTHDANAWPSDLYAGLPAPDAGEQVVLWIQNSHPCAIPAGAVGLNVMGGDRVARLDCEIPAFGSYALDVASLLPGLSWPAQIEIQAGKYFVRPRYEVVTKSGRRRISHPNVERVDLKPDPHIADLGNMLGKGFILPAPILPQDRFSSCVLPTPMSTAQDSLPVAAIVYDSGGREMARHDFGNLPRSHESLFEIDSALAGNGGLPGGYGHVELVYDFAQGGTADGWLHGLFRYTDRASGHAADTSFGAHIFNTVLTYRNEPQSYAGPAPGLSTRLFLRLGPEPLDTMCHLVYPASMPWHGHSQTALILHDSNGAPVATHDVAIPCGGSLHWRYTETFTAAERKSAGDGAYVLVRDQTCRLFGYHGLVNGAGSFSLDHMFGF
ncbi:MAG: hypothetical protein O3B08_15310 [Proteobacteria bacterium]|nr:hypothetical protein [Pseudomonadota bacterium]